MDFKPNPLIYGANEDFLSSFKLTITMNSLVQHKTLTDAVAKAMIRYPYFSVCPERKGNSIVLKHNTQPMPVFEDDRCVTLGTQETNGHLLTFGCEGSKIILNASHYIADGMGIMPLLKTVLYLYVSELYGENGLDSKKINIPNEPVMKEEYEYPFNKKFEKPDSLWFAKKVPENVYSPCCDKDDDDVLYSYHLHIPQKAMMQIANPSDGSPVSFLLVMMYRALCCLDDKIEKAVVAHVQHQYRSVLNAPVSRHSLVSYIPVVLPPKAKDWNVERQNTVVRGQVIINSEPEADICAINRLVSVLPDDDSVSLEEKKQAMRNFVDQSIKQKTFGISYVGKADWSGLEQYVEDIHAYIGEKYTQSMFIIEVMTIGEDFTINFMQKGRTSRFVDAFAQQLKSFDIPVVIVGGEEYSLCDTKIPD